MVQIIINGHDCPLPKDTAFAMKRENPMFTDNGDSTNDVTIPQTPELIAAIGDRRRLDQKKKGGEFDAVIKVNNHTLITGVATITGYTDEDVTFQILGGNSSVNFLSNFEKQYIDNLDLGFALDNIQGKDDSYETFREYVRSIAIYDGYTNPNAQIKNIWDKFLDHRTNQFSLFPVQNNNTVFNHWEYSSYHYTDEAGQGLSHIYIVDEPVGMDDTIWAPQPHFFEILRRIIAAIGYAIDLQDIADIYNVYCSTLYIVNCTETQRYNEMLPHWSVTKFLTEVQNLMGAVFVFNKDKKTCRLVKRERFLKSTSKIFLNDVEDFFEVNVEEGMTTDVSNANLYWGTEENLINAFDDKILSGYKVIEYKSLAKLRIDLTDVGAGLKNPFIGYYNGSYYIWYREAIKNCNDMGAIYRGENNDDVTLNICPAKIGTDTVKFRGGKDWKERYEGHNDTWVYYSKNDTITIPCPIGETAVHSQASLEDYIESGKEESWSLDKMYLCCFKRINTIAEETITYNGHSFKVVLDRDSSVGNRRYWFAWVNYHYMFPDIPLKFECNPSLRINNLNSEDNIDSWGKLAFKQLPNYDTTKEVTIKFYDELPNDFTDRIFVIKNKFYACKEANISFTNEGINVVKEGIFIPIEYVGDKDIDNDDEEISDDNVSISIGILDDNNNLVEPPIYMSTKKTYRILISPNLLNDYGTNIHPDSCVISVNLNGNNILREEKEDTIMTFDTSRYSISSDTSLVVTADLTYRGENFTATRSIAIKP